MMAMSYAHSANRMFWGDELMGWMVMREKTFLGMIHNWQLGLDSGSLFYIVFGRWWMELLSPSELSLRLFSATGMAVSFVIIWICARRFFSALIVACCVPIVYFLSESVAWQFSNGRMYGGFLIGAALASLAFVEADPQRQIRSRTLLLVFGAHAFLIASHILGLMYSGIFLAGMVAQDLYTRELRPKLYLCGVAGWSVLIVSLKNIQGTMALGKPAYWTVRPTWHDLVRALTMFSRPLRFLMLVLVVLTALSAIWKRNAENKTQGCGPRTPLYFLLGTYGAILLVSFSISRVTTSIFLDRYLMPVIFADALILCELVQRVREAYGTGKLLRYAVVTAGLLLFIVSYVHRFRHAYVLPKANFTGALIERDPDKIPMVIADIMLFSEMEFYQNDKLFMMTPVDWSVAADPDAGPGGAAGSREMDNWKAVGYYSNHILPTQEILRTYPNFFLVNEPHHTLWFRRYIVNNPQYRISKQQSFQGDDVWLVERQS